MNTKRRSIGCRHLRVCDPWRRASCGTKPVARLVSLLMLAGPALSSGAVYLWDAGDGTDDNWTTAANWESDIVPIDDGTAEVIFAEGDGLVEVDVARNVAAIAGNNPFNGTLIYG